jgi:hypothetical protein
MEDSKLHHRIYSTTPHHTVKITSHQCSNISISSTFLFVARSITLPGVPTMMWGTSAFKPARSRVMATPEINGWRGRMEREREDGEGVCVLEWDGGKWGERVG